LIQEFRELILFQQIIMLPVSERKELIDLNENHHLNIEQIINHLDFLFHKQEINEPILKKQFKLFDNIQHIILDTVQLFKHFLH